MDCFCLLCFGARISKLGPAGQIGPVTVSLNEHSLERNYITVCVFPAAAFMPHCRAELWVVVRGLQSLKHLFSGPLQNKFSNTSVSVYFLFIHIYTKAILHIYTNGRNSSLFLCALISVLAMRALPIIQLWLRLFFFFWLRLLTAFINANYEKDPHWKT